MVPPPGLEPGRTGREILSLLCLPIPPWRHNGTLDQIRTDTTLLLREPPLPIGLQGQLVYKIG